jgi:hypothetical protein
VSQEDTFILTLPNVGQLRAVTVDNDGSGAEHDWLLAAVEVELVTTGDKLFFPCDTWLSSTKGDKQLARRLTPVDPLRYKATYKVEGARGRARFRKQAWGKSPARSRAKASARLVIQVSAGWTSPSSRACGVVTRFLLSTGRAAGKPKPGENVLYPLPKLSIE